jgi:hypothetical protein
MNQPTNMKPIDLSGGAAVVPILSALSFYSPLIVMISIFMFSVFSAAINKGLFYIACVFFVTALRMLFLYGLKIPQSFPDTPPICSQGVFLPYTGLSYSTFMLAFTALYFVTPMFIISSQNKVNTVNYLVILFFVAYIVFDLFIKMSSRCIKLNLNVLADFLSGGLLGAVIALILFGADKISIMFINELNSSKEVCSVPSKQQFRCSLYKHGMIVGSSISA